MFKLLALCTLLLSIATHGFHSPFRQGRMTTVPLNSAKVSDVVNVDLGDRSYPILIGQDLLTSPEKFKLHVTSKKALIVTNTLVGPLYADKVRLSLEASGVEVSQVTLPDGEEFKNMDVLMTIIDAAMAAKLDRKSTMIALGGGVVGDMCGFAAAIYQRGIRFLQIPTTLMAMVDSAVGGKTAVNHPSGKNMVGAFYQPEAVFIDTDTLNSLPDRELRSGIAEVIKYGLIKDTALFEWLEQNMHRVIAREPAALTEVCIMHTTVGIMYHIAQSPIAHC
jgi:3-dehydroquinate synthase